MSRELAIGIAIILGAIVAPFIKDFFAFLKSLIVNKKNDNSDDCFVTKYDLAQSEKEIMKEVENKFATKEIVNALKEDITEVRKKVNDIYDFLIKQGK